MEKKYLLVDAQQKHKYHPTTFEVPSEKDLSEIEVSDSVKIAVCVNDEGSERFWVTVKSIDSDKFKGVIDNNLVWTDRHGLKDNDEVEFEKKHIHSIY